MADVTEELGTTNTIANSVTKEFLDDTKEKESREFKDSDSDRGRYPKQILPFDSEALRLKQKCKDLKQKIADLEAQNQVRAIGVSRIKDSISRSRFEYSLLLELLEKKASILPIPDLKSLDPGDIDTDSVENLRTEDITNLLLHTPLELLDLKKKFPNALGDLLFERQKQYIKTQKATTETQTKQTRRKRGTANGVTGNSRKRVRDPREPKRPTNAYLFFCDSEREKIKAEWAEKHPNEHIDLSKAMTDVWRTMSNEDKKPYFEKYEKDRARYQKAVEEYEMIKSQELLAAESNFPSEISATASVEPEDEIHSTQYSDADAHIDADASMDVTFDEASHTKDVKNEDLLEEDEEEEDKDESVLGDDASIQGDIESEDPIMNSEIHDDCDEAEEEDAENEEPVENEDIEESEIVNDVEETVNGETTHHNDAEVDYRELKSEPDLSSNEASSH